MDIKTTLKQLSEANGPYGQEGPVSDLIKDLLEPLCDKVTQDQHFNVYGIKKGTGPEPRPQLMYMAHMDEIYMVVTAIEGPFLRFHHFDYDSRVLVGQEVVVLGRRTLHGVIGDRPPHVMAQNERFKAPALKDLVIDVGLDANTVSREIRVGDPVIISNPMIELLGDQVAGKAFDNRISVTAMLAALDLLGHTQHPCDVIVVANVSEEQSGLGALVATYQVRPDVAVVLDVSFGKQPGSPGVGVFKMGGGPVVGLGPNLHDKVTARLIESCEALEMSYSVEPLAGSSGTDAQEVQTAVGGVPTGLVGIAIRNMHTPVEVANLKDVTRTARLLASFAMETDWAFVNDLVPQLPFLEESTV